MASYYNKEFPKNNHNSRYKGSNSPDLQEKYGNNNPNYNNVYKKNNEGIKKISVTNEIKQMKQRREDRKHRKEDEKQHKKDLLNDPNYIPKLDYDFDNLIKQKKSQIDYLDAEPHSTSEDSKIYVCVRKRPIFDKEIKEGEIDCVSAINPRVFIYDCKYKIDGYTKYIDVNEFEFDNVFNENDDTELLYECSVKPSLDILLKGGVVTCFAYGQTGSGKTYTMKGIQDDAIDNIFEDFSEFSQHVNINFKFFISFFEIYSGRLYDLLNNRNKVMALEDKNQKVQIYGLTEKEVFSTKDMKSIIDYANAMRTTHNTVTNETSSRSHAICNFVIKIKGKREDEEYAKLSLVDLAGSERATETQCNNKSRLAEGAEINKSLLALKECIRALDTRKAKGNSDQHVPFRNSKLTLVLRDSFLGKANLCKIIMISCVSPSNHSANHTINTLRYADRLKEKTQKKNLPMNSNNIINNDLCDEKKKNLIQNSQTPVLKSNDNAKFSKIALSINQNPNISKLNNKLNNAYNQKANNYTNNIYDKNDININNIHNESDNINNSNDDYIKNGAEKLNNFFDDLEDLDEDNMQQLDLKPTPISEPAPQKNSFAPKKKNKFALQKKPKTERKNENNNLIGQLNTVDLKNNNEKQLLIQKDEIKEDKKAKKDEQLENGENSPKENKVNGINIDSSQVKKDEQIISSSEPIESISESNTILSDTQKFSYIQEDQNNLIANHMDIIKTEAKILTEEGNLISKIKGVNEQNYTMEEYVPTVEEIIQKKLDYFLKLKDEINRYRELYGQTS